MPEYAYVDRLVTNVGDGGRFLLHLWFAATLRANSARSRCCSSPVRSALPSNALLTASARLGEAGLEDVAMRADAAPATSRSPCGNAAPR
ncbi:hypothetical protein [Sphingomonas sp.]|uniref:hypothetical protein n=1 Tax=Sphingomonas sp. TaxID=28214 RepID=UPI003AFF8505